MGKEINIPQPSKKNGCIIRDCSCKHEYQDEKYGKGKRVYVLNTKGASCTVCSAALKG